MDAELRNTPSDQVNNRPSQSSESFGELLRLLRKRSHLTQSELASLVGYSDAQINRLEKNVRMPDPSVVAARFVTALGLQLDSDSATRLIDLARETARKAKHKSLPNGTQSPVADRHTYSLVCSKLPSPTTELLGRDSDIEAAMTMFSRDSTRLLTLVGPPGVGKTRLAVQLAAELEDQYQHGALFVPLAAVTDGSLIADVLLQVMGVTSNSQDPLAQIKNVLNKRGMVVVFSTTSSNCLSRPVPRWQPESSPNF